MFVGTSQHTVDGKSRVFVPKRIQDGLTHTPTGSIQGYLTPGEDGCLYLFPVATFQAAAAELSTRIFPSDDARAARRMFFGAALPVELDSSGRVLIPEELRERFRIGKEVVVVGVEDRAEIWPVDAWRSYQAKHNGILNKLSHVATPSGPAASGGAMNGTSGASG